jgi:hypothetical protein
MYSITTLSNVAKASIPPSPSSQPFPNMYVDDFESYNVSTEAKYFADQTGLQLNLTVKPYVLIVSFIHFAEFKNIAILE